MAEIVEIKACPFCGEQIAVGKDMDGDIVGICCHCGLFAGFDKRIDARATDMDPLEWFLKNWNRRK